MWYEIPGRLVDQGVLAKSEDVHELHLWVLEVARLESLVGDVLNRVDVASMRSEGEAFDAGSFASSSIGMTT